MKNSERSHRRVLMTIKCCSYLYRIFYYKILSHTTEEACGHMLIHCSGIREALIIRSAIHLLPTLLGRFPLILAVFGIENMLPLSFMISSGIPERTKPWFTTPRLLATVQ